MAADKAAELRKYLDDVLEQMAAGRMGNGQYRLCFAGDYLGDSSRFLYEIYDDAGETISRISRMDDMADSKVLKELGGTRHLDDADDILSAAKGLDGTGGEVKAGTDAMVKASTGFKEGSSFTDIVNNPQNVNIHGNINSELDEVDMINKIIYEDKNASKLYMDNPDFPQTELQWAEKQIFNKGKNRIEALQQDEFRLSSKVSSDLPSAEELREIHNYIFRIDADTPELRNAIQIQLDNSNFAHRF